jgi:hypothetical protein
MFDNEAALRTSLDLEHVRERSDVTLIRASHMHSVALSGRGQRVQSAMRGVAAVRDAFRHANFSSSSNMFEDERCRMRPLRS